MPRFAALAMPTGILTALVLLAASWLAMIYVMPVFVDIYAGYGWQLPWPTRMAIGVARSWLVLLAAVGALAFGLWKLRGAGNADGRQAVWNVSGLLLAAHFIMTTWVLLDFAVRAPVLHDRRAPATQSPAATPAPADSARP